MGNLGKRMTEARALVDGKENLSIEEYCLITNHLEII